MKEGEERAGRGREGVRGGGEGVWRGCGRGKRGGRERKLRDEGERIGRRRREGRERGGEREGERGRAERRREREGGRERGQRGGER